MPRPRKPLPIEVFEDNIADAQRLIGFTRALLNTRRRRMRRELREIYGEAMGLRRRDWDLLDCVESDDVFIVLKPRSKTERKHFTEPELRPLLRQAVVAISAAVESYVSEKACSYIGNAFTSGDVPPRLRSIPLTLGDMLDIEESYQRRRWGQRAVVEGWIQAEASPHPDKIGLVMAAVGKRDFWGKVDNRRGKRTGTSRKQLQALHERRNRIAHTGDRLGSRRASLELEDAEEHFTNAKEIVEALDRVL